MACDKKHRDKALSFRIKQVERDVMSKSNTVAVIKKHRRKSLKDE